MSNDAYEVRVRGRMLPSLLHAIMIARNGVAMSGFRAGAEGVGADFDALVAQAGAPGMFRDVDRYAFHHACSRMETARAFFWFECSEHESRAARLTLVVDERELSLGSRFAVDSPDCARLREIVEPYAHVEALRRPDLTGRCAYDSRWHKHEEAAAPSP